MKNLYDVIVIGGNMTGGLYTQKDFSNISLYNEIIKTS